MSGRGAGGFPLPPLSPGGGAVAAALGAPPPPAGPGMLPNPALRGPGPSGGMGVPGAAAFRPMGPAGPAAQYQVRRAGGRRREGAGLVSLGPQVRAGGVPGQAAQGTLQEELSWAGAGRPESLVQWLGVGDDVGERVKALCGGEFEQLEEFRGFLALSNLEMEAS